MKVIMLADKYSGKESKEFSNSIPRSNDLVADLRTLWEFVRFDIRYKEDPNGIQDILTPPQTWYWRKKGLDCKSKSVFVGSVLKNWKIPFSYRFSNYRPGDFTHVYIIAHTNQGDIIIDTVYDYFNKEKHYYESIDKKGSMTQISYIGSLSKTKGLPHNIAPQTADIGDYYLYNPAQRALILKRDEARILRDLYHSKGFKDLANSANSAVQMFNAVLDGHVIEHDQSGMAKKINGIGCNCDNASVNGFFDDAAAWVDKAAKDTGAWVSQAAKDVTKAVNDTVSTVRREMTNALVKTFLPNAYIAFLPLYVNDTEAAKMVKTFQDKRLLAKNFKQFILDTVGIADGDFMQLVRNEVLKNTGKQPEQLVTGMMSGKKVDTTPVPTLPIKAATGGKNAALAPPLTATNTNTGIVRPKVGATASEAEILNDIASFNAQFNTAKIGCIDGVTTAACIAAITAIISLVALLIKSFKKNPEDGAIPKKQGDIATKADYRYAEQDDTDKLLDALTATAGALVPGADGKISTEQIIQASASGLKAYVSPESKQMEKAVATHPQALPVLTLPKTKEPTASTEDTETALNRETTDGKDTGDNSTLYYILAGTAALGVAYYITQQKK